MFLIVGSGMEALWNGLQVRFIKQLWSVWGGGFVNDSVYVPSLPTILHNQDTNLRKLKLFTKFPLRMAGG